MICTFLCTIKLTLTPVWTLSACFSNCPVSERWAPRKHKSDSPVYIANVPRRKKSSWIHRHKATAYILTLLSTVASNCIRVVPLHGSYFYLLLYFFSHKGDFHKYGVIQHAHTQHRLYSHNVFTLQMSQFPHWSRSKHPQLLYSILYFSGTLLEPELAKKSEPELDFLSRLRRPASFNHSFFSLIIFSFRYLFHPTFAWYVQTLIQHFSCHQKSLSKQSISQNKLLFIDKVQTCQLVNLIKPHFPIARLF